MLRMHCMRITQQNSIDSNLSKEKFITKLNSVTSIFIVLLIYRKQNEFANNTNIMLKIKKWKNLMNKNRR